MQFRGISGVGRIFSVYSLYHASLEGGEFGFLFYTAGNSIGKLLVSIPYGAQFTG